jgi:multiple sugar transport system permease protein
MTQRRRRALTGYALISPWIIGMVVFIAGPIIASAILSFHEYNLLSAPRFIGLDNFVYILTRDPLFWRSVGLTFTFAIIVVILGLSGSLLCALLLTTNLRGSTFFRTALFIPSLTPIVAAGVIWRWLMAPRIGPINWMLDLVGIQGPAWFREPNWALISLVIVQLWITIGGGNMIVFIAGLNAVPTELYDAAKVDGANLLRRFRAVTLPMISPSLLFTLVTTTISALQVFTLAFIVTGEARGTPGGPAYATWFYLVHIYQTGFTNLEMGMASALSWLFFLVVVVIAIVQFMVSRRWVYYESGEA